MADAKMSLLDATNILALKDKLKLPRYSVALRKAAVQALAANTDAFITWDTVESDPDAIFSAGTPTYIVIPTGCNQVRFNATIAWASNSSGMRWFFINEYSTADVLTRWFGGDLYNAAFESHMQIGAGWRPCTPGNRIKAGIRQSSGGSLDVSGGALTALHTSLQVEFRA